jgi:adenylate cyclase
LPINHLLCENPQTAGRIGQDGLAAHCYHLLEVNRWTAEPESNRNTSVELARQALRSSPDDPGVLAIVALVLGHYGEDIDVAVELIDRCLALNPSFARGWYLSGLIRLFAGQPDLALEHFERFLRLSPRDRLANYLTGVGEALFYNHRFYDATAKLLASLEQAPNFVVTYRVLASCYAHMGRLDEARDIVTRLRAITPVVLESATRFRNPEHRELYLSGLRLAAGEET